MTQYLVRFFAIYVASMFKFISGPVLGAAAGFSLLEIVMVTVAGMMTSVSIMTFAGDWVKSYWNMKMTPKRKLFSHRTRRIVRVWRKFGVVGIAAITPLVLTPIGGTIVMTAFNVDKRRIFVYMFGSALFWALVFGSTINWLLRIPIFKDLFG
jgi:hypothetical protein